MPNSLPPVRTPARYVPISAVATGLPGEAAVPVSAANPLPTSASGFSGARSLTPDIIIEPGRAILLDCTGSGTLAIEFADGTALSLSLAAGLSILPFAVRAIPSVGTTAAFDAWVLD